MASEGKATRFVGFVAAVRRLFGGRHKVLWRTVKDLVAGAKKTELFIDRLLLQWDVILSMLCKVIK